MPPTARVSAIPTRPHSQSPVNSSTLSTATRTPAASPSFIREASEASSIRSTAATIGSARQSSLSDIDKELEEFDIDLDHDNVSVAKTGPSASKRAQKKSSDEDEVNARTFRSSDTHTCTLVDHFCTYARLRTLAVPLAAFDIDLSFLDRLGPPIRRRRCRRIPQGDVNARVINPHGPSCRSYSTKPSKYTSPSY